MTRFLTIGFLILVLSCRNKSNHYEINCCEDGQYSVDHNGILFLTESLNYQSLQTLKDTSMLQLYLSNDEMASAFDTTKVFGEFDTTIYYNTELIPWDTLFVTDKFIAELVLIKDNTYGRGYYFQIRTYNNARKIIARQGFATWADRTKEYCSGDYSKSDQTFTVTCGPTMIKYKFDESGKIIPTN